MLVCILNIPCKLFSGDVGREGIDTRTARTDCFQHGGAVTLTSPQSTYLLISILKITPLGTRTVLRVTLKRQKEGVSQKSPPTPRKPHVTWWVFHLCFNSSYKTTEPEPHELFTSGASLHSLLECVLRLLKLLFACTCMTGLWIPSPSVKNPPTSWGLT